MTHYHQLFTEERAAISVDAREALVARHRSPLWSFCEHRTA
ncbi:hypothetical protein ACE3G8_19840 [Vreelandella venusta]